MDFLIVEKLTGLVAVVSALVFLPWLMANFIIKLKKNRALSSEESSMLVDLWQSASAIEDRMKSIETILDKDHPGWKDRYQRSDYSDIK